MADSAVVVTAGTGTNIDTRTEATNGNHRQVVVLGDPSTNAGVAPVDATAGLKVDLGADNDVTVTGNVAVTNAGITTIAGAVSGTEMQVDVLTMPTVTVTANNLDVQSGGADLATSTQAGAIQTAVELIDDTVATLGTTTYTEATTKGLIIGAVRRDADTTLANTTNEVTPLQVDANGYLKVEAFSGQTLPVSLASSSVASGAIASGAVASGAFASGSIASGAIASGAIAAGAIAAGATSIAENEDVARAAADRLVKVAQVRVDAPPANANVSGTEDYTQFIADNWGKTWVAGSVTEDVAHAAGESLMGTGVRRIDTPATSAGSSGDWATMDASAEGAIWATLTPTTTGGCSIFRSLDIDETEEDVKTSAGNVYGYYFGNTTASARYLKFYNATAANVTVGSTTPVITLYLPPTSAGHIAFPFPIGFGTAISVACTTGVADADTGAPSANDVIVMVYYK